MPVEPTTVIGTTENNCTLEHPIYYATAIY